MKEKDWNDLIPLPWKKLDTEEWRWVKPAEFFDSLPLVLEPARRSPARRRSMRWCARCSTRRDEDRTLRETLKEAAAEADETLVKPLLEFRNFGWRCPSLDHGRRQRRVRHRTTPAPRWRSRTSSSTGRARLAISIRTSIATARGSTIEALTVTFKRVPPVKGFWSITLYDQFHFFAPNALDRSLARHQEQGTCASRPTAL